jgi:peptidase E
VLSRDVIWVGGGSLVGLLAVWRAHGLDAVLRRAWDAGVVRAGGSAGALCWHAGGTTTSFGPHPTAVPDGLALVPHSLAVHWDSDPRRRPAHLDAVARGVLPDGYAVEEGVGLLYRGAGLVEAVAERAGGRAFRIERDGDAAREIELPVRLLGARQDDADQIGTAPTDAAPTSATAIP